MLDTFGRNELDSLVASEGSPHLSIYMPTHVAAIDTEQDVRRLKNLVQAAEEKLEEGWMRAAEAKEFLSPVAALIHDREFWSHRQNGLAIFRTQDQLKIYRLGVAFEERMSISRSFLVRPIVPLIHQGVHGFALALSQHRVTLYEIGEQWIQPVLVPGMPVNIEQTLNYTSVDRGQQAHTGSSATQGKGSEVYHGQGGKADARIDDLRHFFRAVDEAVAAYLGDSKEPLILACVDSSVSIYREVNSYSGLRHEFVAGNADYLEPKELLPKVAPILEAEQTQRRESVAHRIREHLNTSVASEKANEVIRAAFQGRVHTLFFDERAVVEGQFDPILQSAVVYADNSNVKVSPYNTDLVERTVQQTLRHKGDVYSVPQAEMPGHGPLAALFRY